MNELIREVLGMLDQVARDNEVTLPPGATDQEIVSFEGRTGLKIPAEIKAWLKICNGPRIPPGNLYGIATHRKDKIKRSMDIEMVYSTWPECKRLRWIPLGGDGFGNCYVISVGEVSNNGHPVFFIDTISDYLKLHYSVASDVWHFLRFLLREGLGQEYWPFQKDRVLEEDPELENVSGAPKPWEKIGGSGPI